MATYIIINSGSSSKRYSFFNHNQEITTWYLEQSSSPKKVYAHSGHIFLNNLLKERHINSVNDIDAVAFRIVAPGTFFTEHKKINASYLKKLVQAANIAPLHIETTLAEILNYKKLLPHCQLYGISDSAFHTTLSDNAKIYGLPKQITKKYDIYRFGYHGISCASVMRNIKKLPNGSSFKKIVLCHLSGGSSITAIKNGISIDTSMGFTPLEGVPMVSRCGNIDAGALMYLFQEGASLKTLKNLLFNQSGMIGLTDRTDMRTIVALAQQGNSVCAQAIELFVYHIQKYIGSYAAILGGIDFLVFTGGIGENSPFIRERICHNLSSLGILLDHKKNSIEHQNGFIESKKSATKIGVFKTEEMKEIAQELLNVRSKNS